MAEYTPIDKPLDWDEEIINDGNEFTLLPEGDCSFTVKKFERGRHNGSDKLPACNKAILTLELTSDETGDTTTLEHNLFLHTKTEGMLSQFFASIGQKKKGEPLRMNWQSVPGSTGRCKVVIDEWTGKNGDPMKNNKIKKFYPAEVEFTEGAF